jgi:hypothetical protein
MAQKRMFDKGLIETDSFMDMPMPTKALYFLLGMEADDEGFVSPTRVMRIYGGNADDLKVLIAKKFVIQFESGVVVITDWKKNNWLDNRRIRKTIYQNEMALLSEKNEKYCLLSNGLATAKQPLSDGLASIEENRIEENSTEESRRGEYEGRVADAPSPAKKQKPILSLEEKNQEFIKQVNKNFNYNIPLELKPEIQKFILYWTEPNKSKTKIRWEMEKTWDVKRRIATWMNNSRKFNRVNERANEPLILDLSNF